MSNRHRSGQFKNPIIALGFMVAPALWAAEPIAPTIGFNRDIRPLLSGNCMYCHGPDSTHRKAGLRLDQQQGLFGERKTGTVVVKGDPARSLLIQRINSTDDDEVMPPAESHKSLSAEQKALLKKWIEQGANWEPHWSLVPPSKPVVPTIAQPGWENNPIDAFVLKKLHESGLEPQPQADRRTLIRRVSLDIIGLPPSPQDVENFIADQSPNAYEKVVDRLLTSPRYGEHRARYWLDYARYGDTHGIHNDNYREIWPYRDWVISAFNRNERFDQFTLEQIAGDLLPNRTMEQQIATGFHRCNATTSEGGSISDEVLAFYAKDRAETTAEVWLGLTAGCAVCHDHKFDPVTQKDFYSLTAFFRNTPQAAMDGNIPDTPPVIVVPTPEDRPRYTALKEQTAKLDETTKQITSRSGKAFKAWLESPSAKTLAQPLAAVDQAFAAPLNEGTGTLLTAHIRDTATNLAMPTDAKWVEGPAKTSAIEFGSKTAVTIPNAVDFDSGYSFTVSCWVKIPSNKDDFLLASKLDRKAGRGWQLEVNKRNISFRLMGGRGDSIVFSTPRGGELTEKKWEHLAVTYDGSKDKNGIIIYVNGRPFDSGRNTGTPLKGSISTTAPLLLGSDGAKYFTGGAMADFRIVSRNVGPDEVAQLMAWSRLRPMLAKNPATITGADRSALQGIYLAQFEAGYRNCILAIQNDQTELRTIARRGAITHVMQDIAGQEPEARVLYRGQYDQPREEVRADTPAALHPFPKDAPHNRLGLAQWILRPENPLTCRVVANRLWQEVFGTGIVRTSEDFGVMGENPSNPELLDWLAIEFRESGWDMKHLLKRMVTSAAYQQMATVTPQALKLDPANRLLSRGPRFRMDAETVRDFALQSAGLLSDKIGGPSVRPYQPPGVWEAVAMFGSNTRFYKQDDGDKLYRRSMYTFWKRSAPPASMDIFNAPTREACTLRRERTNTPLQALVTLNDPQWIEAARVLAEKAILDSGSDGFEQRLDSITMRVLARKLDQNERSICRSSLNDLLVMYQSKPDAARELISDGQSKPDARANPWELAAWTMLTSEVMNLDEALNK